MEPFNSFPSVTSLLGLSSDAPDLKKTVTQIGMTHSPDSLAELPEHNPRPVLMESTADANYSPNPASWTKMEISRIFGVARVNRVSCFMRSEIMGGINTFFVDREP